jgi:hypothetical protein
MQTAFDGMESDREKAREIGDEHGQQSTLKQQRRRGSAHPSTQELL